MCSGTVRNTTLPVGVLHRQREASVRLARLPREQAMPVIFLWGIPALIVIGGGAYWLVHLH
jgi:hypothetical protein